MKRLRAIIILLSVVIAVPALLASESSAGEPALAKPQLLTRLRVAISKAAECHDRISAARKAVIEWPSRPFLYESDRMEVLYGQLFDMEVAQDCVNAWLKEIDRVLETLRVACDQEDDQTCRKWAASKRRVLRLIEVARKDTDVCPKIADAVESQKSDGSD